METARYQTQLLLQLEQVRADIIQVLPTLHHTRDLNNLESATLEQLIEMLKNAAEHDLEPMLYRLRRIDAAQCQLEMGLFGLCADCEQNIEVERLLRDATVQRCQACADKFRANKRESYAL